LHLGFSAPADWMRGHALTPAQKDRWTHAALTVWDTLPAAGRWMSIEPLVWDLAPVLERHRPLEWAVIGAASAGAQKYQPDPRHLENLLAVLGNRKKIAIRKFVLSYPSIHARRPHMELELTETLKTIFVETAKTLKGAARRLFMARIVQSMGRGGAQRAEEALGWNRGTLRKGGHELESGLTCVDNTSARGRDRAEEHWPTLAQDIRELVKPESQIDPSFKTERQYTRVSAATVRQQLIEKKGYAETDVPSRRTVSTQLNTLGFYLRKVAKSKPKKKLPETDAIFEEVHRVNQEADAACNTLRISLDAKAGVKIGEFSRGGDSRVPVAAADHDFKPEATVTPFGFLLPHVGDLFLYMGTSKITSDFIVDCLTDLWQNTLRPRFPAIDTLVLNLDNGPENHSRRTQFLNRLVGFVAQERVTVRLAYYPPYHSKYNPIEHCWGSLEQHWNADLLDEVATVVKFAESMLWNGMHPVVNLVTKIYETGVCLTEAAMAEVEAQVKRLPHLEKWFVEISPANISVDI